MGFFQKASRLAPAALLLLVGNVAAGHLSVTIGSTNNVLPGPVDGRVVVLFAPNGANPLDGTDDYTENDPNGIPDQMYAINVASFGPGDTVTLSGGSADYTETGVWGWQDVSVDTLKPGSYNVQAFLTPYETVTRSDGSQVKVKFPCGDGAPKINGVGSLKTSVLEVVVQSDDQDQNIILAFNSVTTAEPSTGHEIGDCYQGNYPDVRNLHYIKIRSPNVSEFWGRDMYVGANVLLPAGYNASDKETRYPVLYLHYHFPGASGPYQYPDTGYADEWDNGMIKGKYGQPDQPTPKFIIVKLRHEVPFGDNSYALNTANVGPYGDAINDELIPYIDAHFNTIAEPYGRINTGFSTGGWIAAQLVAFRPDIHGACFAESPDPMDFHSLQRIPLYTNTNAYFNADNSSIPSIRDFDTAGNELVIASTESENYWELIFGTSSRSNEAWDGWAAVWAPQALNGYPLAAWEKVTGEIFPGAVEYWRDYDLADYITRNWDKDTKNLGEVLQGRMTIIVGSRDDFYLDGGVAAFQKRVEAKGGQGWANITIVPQGRHDGSLYTGDDYWQFFQRVVDWSAEHAPNGPKPLTSEQTSAAHRGNVWQDVLARGGRAGALARQGIPVIHFPVQRNGPDSPIYITATPGRWDPGVKLTAQWIVDGVPCSGKDGVPVGQDDTVQFALQRTHGKTYYQVQLAVTGNKRDYQTETRMSERVNITP